MGLERAAPPPPLQAAHVKEAAGLPTSSPLRQNDVNKITSNARNQAAHVKKVAGLPTSWPFCQSWPVLSKSAFICALMMPNLWDGAGTL